MYRAPLPSFALAMFQRQSPLRTVYVLVCSELVLRGLGFDNGENRHVLRFDEFDAVVVIADAAGRGVVE